MADLSQLSTEELLALKAGDYSKLSTDSLVKLRGQSFAAPVAEPSPEFMSTDIAPEIAGGTGLISRQIRAAGRRGQEPNILELGYEGDFFSDTPTPEQSAAALKTFAAVLGGEAVAAPVAALRGAGIYRQAMEGLKTGAAAGAAGGAVEAAPEIAGGQYADAAKQFGQEVALGAGTGLALPVLIRFGGAAIRGGLDARKKVADLFRPVELSPDQLRALRSRETIRLESGVEVPLGISDAIRSGTLTKRLQEIEGAEVSPEDLQSLSELSLHLAANAPRGTRSPQDVAKLVYDALDPQRQGLNRQATALVEAFSRRAAREVNASESAVRGAARRFFPAGRSVKTIGEEIGEVADQALKSSQDDWNAAYLAARKIPEYNTTLVDLDPVIQAAQANGLQFLRKGGKLNVLGAPSGARQAVQEGQQIPSTATIDEARNLVTELGRNVRNQSFLPGVDVRVKMDLLDTAKRAIDSAIEPVPALKQALDDANRMYAENIGRFRNSFAKGILQEVGEKGGLTGEEIVSRLTGANAETNIEELSSILGAGATAGKDFSRRGTELVREAVLSTAATAGRQGGEINVGRAFGTIDKLFQRNPAVFGRMFPNYKQMRSLFLREGKISAARSNTADAEKFLDSLDVSRADMEQALSAGSVADLENIAKRVVQRTEQVKGELRSLGLDKLAERSTFDIVKFVKDPANTAKLQNLASTLERKDPTTLQDVRALFLDELLQKASTRGKFDAAEFQRLVQQPQPTVGATAGRAGQPAGTYYEAANALLGGPGSGVMRRVAKALEEMPLPDRVGADVQRSALNYAVGGYSGGPATALVGQPTAASNITFFNRLAMLGPEVRYKFAAAMLSRPDLRELAMQPVGEMSARAINRAAALTANLIAEQYGSDSEVAKDARMLQDQALKLR